MSHVNVTFEELQDRLESLAPEKFTVAYGKQYLKVASLLFKALDLLEKKTIFFTDHLRSYEDLDDLIQPHPVSIYSKTCLKIVLKDLLTENLRVEALLLKMKTLDLDKKYDFLNIPSDELNKTFACDYLGFCVCDDAYKDPYNITCLSLDKTLLPQRNHSSGTYQHVGSWKGEIVKVIEKV